MKAHIKSTCRIFVSRRCCSSLSVRFRNNATALNSSGSTTMKMGRAITSPSTTYNTLLFFLFILFLTYQRASLKGRSISPNAINAVWQMAPRYLLRFHFPVSYRVASRKLMVSRKIPSLFRAIILPSSVQKVDTASSIMLPM